MYELTKAEKRNEMKRLTIRIAENKEKIRILNGQGNFGSIVGSYIAMVKFDSYKFNNLAGMKIY